MRQSSLRFLMATTAVVAIAVVLGSSAQAATTNTPTLFVVFTPTGVVSVTLPDGTPVGTASGSPTIIPPGNYTVVLNGPGDCTPEPTFALTGAGVDLNSDMLGSETNTYDLYMTLQANATYKWYTTWDTAAVYSFATSATPAASVPSTSSATPNSGTSSSAGASTVPTAEDVVGSAIVPFRGKLGVAVSAAGKLIVTFGGRSVTTLKSGRYTVSVTVRSRSNGLVLKHGADAATTVTGSTTFVGTRSASVDLATGTWRFMLRLGKQHPAVAVSVVG